MELYQITNPHPILKFLWWKKPPEETHVGNDMEIGSNNTSMHDPNSQANAMVKA